MNERGLPHGGPLSFLGGRPRKRTHRTALAKVNPHLYQRDVENIVNAILGEITNAMAKGDRVELRGFGAFSVKHRPAHNGRNPRTGAHVAVEQKSAPFFKTGKVMRERLNRTAAS